MIIGKNQNEVTKDIKKHVKERRRRNTTPRLLARYLSVKAPAQTITIAEKVVLIAYKAPHSPSVRENSFIIWPANKDIKKVWP
jgi:hypothetical protein